MRKLLTDKILLILSTKILNEIEKKLYCNFLQDKSVAETTLIMFVYQKSLIIAFTTSFLIQNSIGNSN